MTPDEAFKKFLAAHEHNDLPWEMQEEEMRPTFMAGWHAHAESLNQTTFALTGESAPAAPVPPAVNHGVDERQQTVTVCGSVVTAETIYAAYPRKIGKQAALKAIAKAAKSITGWILIDQGPHPRLLRAVEKYAAATAKWPAADKQFIPHPATWFNRGSYDDDPKEWQRGAGAFSSQFSRS